MFSDGLQSGTGHDTRQVESKTIPSSFAQSLCPACQTLRSSRHWILPALCVAGNHFEFDDFVVSGCLDRIHAVHEEIYLPGHPLNCCWEKVTLMLVFKT